MNSQTITRSKTMTATGFISLRKAFDLILLKDAVGTTPSSPIKTSTHTYIHKNSEVC